MNRLRFTIITTLISMFAIQLIIPSIAHLNTKRSLSLSSGRRILMPALQSSNIRFKEINPVVNEGKQLPLTAVDLSGQVVADASFESGSPDIAAVDPKTGMVNGVQRGFATITARRGSESVSTFVVVARVASGNGPKVPGEMAQDTGSRIYLSDPLGSVILRKDGFASEAKIFAGRKGTNGRMDGKRTDALFAGPTAVTVDNSTRGGIYIADTLNHSIRKISFQDEVTTVLGTGAPGINMNDSVPFAQAAFNGPRGIAADANGNLYIADTDNHAIYFADFVKKEVRLLAGNPGVSGKADGKGRTALFKRPSGIELKSDGKVIAVADKGNDRVRLITRDGTVTTISSSANRRSASGSYSIFEQAADDIEFNAPQSVNFDGVGNIYVVDGSNAQAQVITGALKNDAQVVSLAQAGTFGQAVSVVVNGTQTFVLDNNSMSDADAVKVVTVGAPQIESLSQDIDRLEGGAEVIVTGKNFAPETQLTLGDAVVTDFEVESATRIRFRVPKQTSPGGRNLTVQTRGGAAQRKFTIVSKPLLELSDGEITTVAGGIPFLGDGGSAISPSTSLSTVSIAIDGAGNLFIADRFNNRIRRVDASTGIITTVAGNGRDSFSGDGGPAVSASLDTPEDIAIDGTGNLFIADTANDRIRRVDAATGIITTVAGNGSPSFSGDGGPAVNAGLAFPSGISIDGAGNIFIADSFNNRIRRIDASTGIITTVAGNGRQIFSSDGGPAVSASISPEGISIDGAGNIFIADTVNDRIRRVDAATGIITTVAGGGNLSNGLGDGGSAISASLRSPRSVAIDGAGNLFIADSNSRRIRRVDASTRIITTVAGGGNPSNGLGDGGPAISASLAFPPGIAIDGAGNLFIADRFNNRIRRVDASTGIIITVAGNGSISLSGDGGPAVSASLLSPNSVAVDGAGNLFIADTFSDRICRVDANTGIITTVAGGGNPSDGLGDGGPAVSASLDTPLDISIDGAGNLFIADTFNELIRRVDASTGIITTVAGNGRDSFSGDGGPAVKAGLSPDGITIDRAGNIFIAETFSDRIRRVDANTGIITTVAGSGPVGLDKGGFSGDGGPAVNARLDSPQDIAIDGAGNIFIADAFNNRIRRVDASTRIITTVAGNGNLSNSLGDGGPAVSAGLAFPSGIAIDGAGNIFIADAGIRRIRRVDANTGIITTVAGGGNPSDSLGDDGPAVSASISPEGIAIDGAGNLFIADRLNNVIRAVKGIAKSQGGNRQVVINNVSFNKPNLIIDGNGFTGSGTIVNVNGADVSKSIIGQTDTRITLKGNNKKLNLSKGPNQVTVIANGVASNTFTFNLFAEE